MSIIADTVTANGRRQVISGTPGRLVPEFAVGHLISTMTLAGIDSLRLRSVRCSLTDYSLAIFDIQASISEIEHTRDGQRQPEPAWLIRGAVGYPYELVVARKDRVVLREVIPQGSVGIEIREYRSARDARM